MQKTNRLKLNLMEDSDHVSPEPINENAQLLEAEADAIRADLATLATEVGDGGQVCRIISGTYTGTGTYGEGNKNTLTFAFVPMVVRVFPPEGSYAAATMLRNGNTALHGNYTFPIEWGEHSVSWYSKNSAADQLNYSGKTYHYIAFG